MLARLDAAQSKNLPLVIDILALLPDAEMTKT